MENDETRDFAMDLLFADSEDQVIALLRDAGYWDDHNMWRLYGDKEGNFAQAGNQQSLPEAALVEKIINSVDSRLMAECLKRGIDPEGAEAPVSVRDAVAMFFENRRSVDDVAGNLTTWSSAQRTAQSKEITISATGDRPAKGKQRTKSMCLTIVDRGEGQSPDRLPHTILSLNAKNKQRIRFVQGKFNMGGSGALRFCGTHGLQLVISKRNPELGATNDGWGVTIVRREEPSNKSGDPIHSEFTYLAPVGSDKNPRRGEVLSFSAANLPLLPQHDNPYKVETTWGTALKLYEYQTSVGQSNILMKDGLLYALERLLPEVALPIRLHECRGYKGEKERSYETPLAGLAVRLEDGRGDNLEDGFPTTAIIKAAGLKMTARIYAFKEEKAATYLKDEGVIFCINGQAHGYIPKTIFARPKAVGLSRLKDSLLVVVDCSTLGTVQREDLFMSSRDRLSKNPIRTTVEKAVEEVLKEHQMLRKLQLERRAADVNTKLNDERPLAEVIGKVLKASPTLKTLFLEGRRLANPFDKRDSGIGGERKGEGDGRNGKGQSKFTGARHPTFFRVAGVEYGVTYERTCEEGRHIRIKFETDVVNEYFDRPTDRGSFELEFADGRGSDALNYTPSLQDGEMILTIELPDEYKSGDDVTLLATVMDPTLVEPFVNTLRLSLIDKVERKSGSSKMRKPHHEGAGDDGRTSGLNLPKVIEVETDDVLWRRHNFDERTAIHVISDQSENGGGVEHVFYVNVNNLYLETELKFSRADPRLLRAKFKYANVLLGLALLHEDGQGTKTNKDDFEVSIQDKIRHVSTAVAPIILPMIDQLSGLEESELAEVGMFGEDG